MAGSRKKPKAKHRAVAVLDVAFSLVAEMPPSCDALFAAAEAIHALIAENCSIANVAKLHKELLLTLEKLKAAEKRLENKGMQQATKRAVKK